MPRPEIVRFDDSHLDRAAELLAERHARHRTAEPLLPAAADFRGGLEQLWAKEGASGVFAEGGYLIGVPRDDSWGPNVWIEAAGHAVQEPELVRDLYAAAAADWVEQGRTRHYALVPAGDRELVDAWFRLGFGQQQAYGVLALPVNAEVAVPEGFEIRAPRPEEVEELIDVDLALPQHQRSSPVFSPLKLRTRDESRAEWLATIDGDEEKIFIGARGEHPVACWALVSIDQSRDFRDLFRPNRASYLSFASTLPEARGSGIGVALTNASFAWAAEQGYDAMVTDWRVTNLLASRFWPRRGFRTAFLRLYRSIP